MRTALVALLAASCLVCAINAAPGSEAYRGAAAVPADATSGATGAEAAGTQFNREIWLEFWFENGLKISI